MKPTPSDPFAHVPAGSQVSIFVWHGRRERCEGRLSQSFGTDHKSAKAYYAKHAGGENVAKVQVVAGWFADGAVPERRMDCYANGRMTVRERDLAWRPRNKYPDADAFADLLDAA